MSVNVLHKRPHDSGPWEAWQGYANDLEAENKQLQANFKWAMQERGRENTALKRVRGAAKEYIKWVHSTSDEKDLALRKLEDALLADTQES